MPKQKTGSPYGSPRPLIVPPLNASTSVPQLIFEVLKTEKAKGTDRTFRFTISIIDEKTLQWMEQRYPGKLQSDGRHYFLTFSTEVHDPKDLMAEAVHKYVLERIRRA